LLFSTIQLTERSYREMIRKYCFSEEVIEITSACFQLVLVNPFREFLTKINM